jgi:hypothetical protein
MTEETKKGISKLSPLRSKIVRPPVVGFDIETADDNKTFLCSSFYTPEYQKTIFTKEEFREELLNRKIYHNAFIGATNLSFDFFGSVFGEDIEKHFKLLFRGSDLIFAKTYVYKSNFYSSSKIQTPEGIAHARTSITFIDSMNYTKMSVKSLGDWIGIPKIESPLTMGKTPQTPEEWETLITYNMRDSEITQKAINKLFDGFIDLGAKPRLTIASTGMDLWRRQYLDTDYYNHDKQTLYELFESYVGGRTEVFTRGHIEGYNYYDFNSLYPFCMTLELPDPNTHKRLERGIISNIYAYEGCSRVKCFCPNMKYPVLPVKTGEKLIFPVGNIEGCYNHVELRYAVSLGYEIKEISVQHIFTRKCSPFRSYAISLYEKRKIKKKEGDPIEMVIKLLLNSLYGKTGQRFFNRDTIMHKSQFTMDILKDVDTFEFIGNYVRIMKVEEKPSVFCFPEWASHITSHARLKLHQAMVLCNPVYVDTDSMLTKMDIPCSDKLGDLKLEMFITEGFIIKPKFYCLIDDKDKEHVKIKGVHKKMLIEGMDDKGESEILPFQKFIAGERITIKTAGFQKNISIAYLKDNIIDGSLSINMLKFMKFREAIRRDKIPNEIVPILKVLDLEDTKRLWSDKFDLFSTQESKAISL